MKLLFVNDSDVHLGCLEMEGDKVVIKKYKPEFKPEIVDAPEEDDLDDMEDIEQEAMEEDADKEGKMSDVFALKKKPEQKEEKKEEVEYEDEDEEEQDVKKGKPMKQKRPGLF